MFFYFFSIISSFILSLAKRERIIDFLFFFALTLFLCFGYMTGSDWDTYEHFYNIGFDFKTVEPGYMFLSNFFSSLGINFWLFHIAIKCICFYIIMKTIMRKSEDSFFALMFFLSSFGFFLFIDCPFRNLIAVSIFLIGIKYIETDEWVKFIAIVLLASSFHIISLILIPVYYVKRLSKIKTINLLIFYGFLYLFFLIGGINIIMKGVEYLLPFLYKRMDFYIGKSVMESSLFSPGLLFRIVCLIFMSFYRERIKANYDRGEFVFNLSYVYLILSLISYALPLVFRLALFLSPFYVIILAMIAKELKNYSSLIFKTSFFFAALFVTWITISSKSYYVPYSNILPYVIKGEYPDYDYRSNYNKNNSPFK